MGEFFSAQQYCAIKALKGNEHLRDFRNSTNNAAETFYTWVLGERSIKAVSQLTLNRKAGKPQFAY